MKKVLIVAGVLLVVVVGIYLYLQHGLLKAKDFKPDTSKKESALDLRPAIIAKLQQLVKDGSDGLYLLSIDTLEPNIIASTVEAKGVRLDIDSSAYRRLDKEKKLPDDVFRLRLSALHINGFGIEDLLHKKRFSVSAIIITAPVIEDYHKKQPYNKEKRERQKELTLYQKLKAGMDRIAIGKVRIKDATFINNDGGGRSKKTTSYNSISIALDDILIDSSTQYATDRMLFAKATAIEAKAYSIPIPDSMYELRVASVAISGPGHDIQLRGLEMKPRGGREAYERKLKLRKVMFDLSFPDIEMKGVNWWAMLHGEELKAAETRIVGGRLYTYLDRNVPKDPKMTVANFPQQVIMALPLPISFGKVHISGADILYEERAPDVTKSGTITFNNVSAEATNFTNVADEVARSPIAHFTGHCLFMNKTPFSATFQLFLPKSKHGAFIVDVQAGAANGAEMNPFAAPLGDITITSGQMQHSVAHVEGNNFHLKGNVAAAYTDLHIVPLKTDGDGDGKQKKKKLTGFLANVLLIKNNNPGRKGGKLRAPDFTMDRGHADNMFNFGWSGVKIGLLKTVGIPVSLGMKGQ